MVYKNHENWTIIIQTVVYYAFSHVVLQAGKVYLQHSIVNTTVNDIERSESLGNVRVAKSKGCPKNTQDTSDFNKMLPIKTNRKLLFMSFLALLQPYHFHKKGKGGSLTKEWRKTPGRSQTWWMLSLAVECTYLWKSKMQWYYQRSTGRHCTPAKSVRG